MEQVSEALARWAVGPGRAAIDRATAELARSDDELAVGTRLREGLDGAQAAFAMAAAATRLRARAQGVPGADDLVLTRESLEQASHPAAAAWRADRGWAANPGTGMRLQDRCAGTGGDAVAMAAHGPVLAIERDPGRAVLAADRAAVLGVDVEVLVGDALDPSIPATGAVVHADPDRRDAQGRRAHGLGGHRPGVAALLAATAAARGHLITVAPGLDWDDPELPADAEVVFLQHGRDLKEAVVCTGAARQQGARATAVLLHDGSTRTRTDATAEQLPVGSIGDLLLLPAPALVRARLHDAAGEEVGARRLGTRSALLALDGEAPTTPWFDAEVVEAVLPARGRGVREHLRAHPDRRVEVILHGLQLDVRQWLREAGSPPTGPADLRIHLVRRDHDAVAVLTTAAAAHA